jgi:hypothetical protein
MLLMSFELGERSNAGDGTVRSADWQQAHLVEHVASGELSSMPLDNVRRRVDSPRAADLGMRAAVERSGVD